MNYVYKLLDKDGNVLYVGKTNNLKRRLTEHITNQEWASEIDSLYYATCRDDFEQRTYENYYIIKSNPKYNKQDKSFSTHIILPELKWQKFEDVETLEQDDILKKKMFFLLENWTLINSILDLCEEMFEDVQDPREISIYDVYAIEMYIEELQKRRKNFKI